VLIWTGSIDTIWPMFGIANQLLAVIGLCLVTTVLVNTGRGRYAPVTLLPMLFVTATTLTAGGQMIPQFMRLIKLGPERGGWGTLKGTLNIGLMVFVMTCVAALLMLAVARWLAVGRGVIPVRAEGPGLVTVDGEQPGKPRAAQASLAKPDEGHYKENEDRYRP
jgi:carbon starvation protein